MKRLSDRELAERGWSRCRECGAIRSPYTGLDWNNHTDWDCSYMQNTGMIVASEDRDNHPWRRPEHGIENCPACACFEYHIPGAEDIDA